MAKRITERRLVDVLIRNMREHHATARELSHYEKRIDIAVFCEKSEELWAIEVKTSNWARALSQAIVNLAAAQRSYIAIYSKHAGRVNTKALGEYGIGLISVGTKWGDVRILKPAERSPYTNALVLERLQLQVRGGKS